MLDAIEVPMRIPPVYEVLDNQRTGKRYDYYTIKGGRGSAKSESIGRRLLLDGIEEPRKIVCGREFQSSIKESVYDMLGDFVSTYKLDKFYNVLKTEIIAKNRTSFSFVGLRHSINSIKSMYDVDDFWGEEAQTFSENTLKILLPTIRKPRSRLFFTMNPDLEEDASYQMLVVNPPPNTLVLTVNHDQNPYFPDRLRALMEQDKAKDYQRYLNVWEGHCRASVEGAIYGQALQKATDEGRIGEFPYDSRYPVSVFLDIGWADNTSLWFLQFVNHQPRAIDCYQSQFQKTPHYIQVMNERGYTYNKICLPHDAENEHANADRTWMQIFRQAFPNANVYSGKRQAIELRLEATKNMFDMIFFHKAGTVDGRSALAHYHYATDPNTGKSTREPFHGPESNYSDAFGYMCLEMKEPSKPIVRKKTSIYSGQ